ncbi:branched-chain amino acid ABC transporter substrate-binding protein [Aestuariivirga sp.]|uniref:branched-chain amino acid ABC transporter substrate-binding protein n=1 Tax=Aestuariivirga sp. TaxID=2650926 RepID=UPI0039E32C12
MKPIAALLCAALLLALPARADILIGTAGPMSGANASFGEQMRRGAQRAVDDYNASGGLSGQPLSLIASDDGCEPRKAVDVATDFVSKGVKLVAGHFCSGASVPAAKVYNQANILMISPASTNPKLTDAGLWNVFRVCQRDDAEGTFAGKYIAAHYRDQKIAILNDKSPSGAALAAKVRQALSAAAMTPVIDETYTPGAKDYGDIAVKLRNSGAAVLYIGGTYVEAGLIIRELRDMGSGIQLIGSNALVTDEFGNIAKDAADGTLMSFAADPQRGDAAKAVLQHFANDDFQPEGYTLNAYAAVQVFVQAAEATGGTDAHRIADWLHAGNRVQTVLGNIGFDAKGDLLEQPFVWFRWTDGRYVEAPDVH